LTCTQFLVQSLCEIKASYCSAVFLELSHWRSQKKSERKVRKLFGSDMAKELLEDDSLDQ